MANGVRVLDEERLFGCLSIECTESGAVYVPRGTPEGAVITHVCGSKGILTGDGRSWSLQPIQEENMAEGEVIQVEDTLKKKRGRPAGSKNKPKVNGAAEAVAAEPSEDELLAVAERDSNLLRNVEADCPHPAGTAEFIHWCEKEFDKRKAAVEAGAPAPARRGRKAKEVVESADIVLNESFITKATAAAADVQDAVSGFWDTFDTGKRKYWAVGETILHFEQHKYYLAFGAKSLREWMQTAFRETLHLTSMYDARDLVKNAKHRLGISSADFSKIPIQTARLLKAAPQEKVTPEIIEAAKSLTNKDFTLQYADKIKDTDYIADGATGEPAQPQTVTPVNVSGFRKITPAVADEWKYALDIARWKGSELRDDTGLLSVDDRALYVIAHEIKEHYEDEYQEHLKRQKLEQQAVVDAADEPAF